MRISDWSSDVCSSDLQHLIRLREWDEDRHAALGEELTEKVRTAAKEGEAVGALGQSKPSVREMFEGVFKEPDWRVIEQRRSEEHTSELQSLMRISYAVFCLKKKKPKNSNNYNIQHTKQTITLQKT